jgi:hypothetical protein
MAASNADLTPQDYETLKKLLFLHIIPTASTQRSLFSANAVTLVPPVTTIPPDTGGSGLLSGGGASGGGGGGGASGSGGGSGGGNGGGGGGGQIDARKAAAFDAAAAVDTTKATWEKVQNVEKLPPMFILQATEQGRTFWDEFLTKNMTEENGNKGNWINLYKGVFELTEKNGVTETYHTKEKFLETYNKEYFHDENKEYEFRNGDTNYPISMNYKHDFWFPNLGNFVLGKKIAPILRTILNKPEYRHFKYGVLLYFSTDQSLETLKTFYE